MAQASKNTVAKQTESGNEQVIKKLIEEVQALKTIVKNLNERLATLRGDVVSHVDMYNDHIRRLHM